MTVMHLFSQHLKELRESAGLNQSQLAEELKVSRGSISFYENMDRVPDVEFLSTAAKFFHVSTDWLLGLSDVRSPDANIQQVCKYTGLSEAAVKILGIHHFAYCNASIKLSGDVSELGLSDTTLRSAFNISELLSFIIEQSEFNNIQITTNDAVNAIIVGSTIMRNPEYTPGSSVEIDLSASKTKTSYTVSADKEYIEAINTLKEYGQFPLTSEDTKQFYLDKCASMFREILLKFINDKATKALQKQEDSNNSVDKHDEF